MYLSNEADVSRIKVKFVIEGLGEAEGELGPVFSAKNH